MVTEQTTFLGSAALPVSRQLLEDCTIGAYIDAQFDQLLLELVEQRFGSRYFVAHCQREELSQSQHDYHFNLIHITRDWAITLH